MAETEETLPQNSDTRLILQAIADLSKRIDSLEKQSDKFETLVNNQFEVARREFVDNSAAHYRLQALFHRRRSDFYSLRADIKESAEQARRKRMSLK